jgi:hypothetical protein
MEANEADWQLLLFLLLLLLNGFLQPSSQKSHEQSRNSQSSSTDINVIHKTKRLLVMGCRLHCNCIQVLRNM